MEIFGFVVPPIGTPGSQPDASPQKIIALDNSSYSVIDLNAEARTELFKIHTGIGGYMPRYLCKTIETNTSFFMVTMC